MCSMRASSLRSIVLDKVSDTPFWTTVKSAFPTEMMAAADCSRPLLVTPSVTTVMTAKATAKSNPIERAFFFHRLRRMRSKKVMDVVCGRRSRREEELGSQALEVTVQRDDPEGCPQRESRLVHVVRTRVRAAGSGAWRGGLSTSAAVHHVLLLGTANTVRLH